MHKKSYLKLLMKKLDAKFPSMKLNILKFMLRTILYKLYIFQLDVITFM